jgi:hypothetical protein
MIRPPNWGTIQDACTDIGGKSRPVHKSTYYRGARDGRYPPPDHPSPNIARVDLDKLAVALRTGTYNPDAVIPTTDDDAEVDAKADAEPPSIDLETQNAAPGFGAAPHQG